MDPVGGHQDEGDLHIRTPYGGVRGGARPHSCGYTDTGSLTGIGERGGMSSTSEMSGAHGVTGEHGLSYNHVNVGSEPARRGGRQSGEPSLLSMIRASPEEFQRMCEECDRAEFVHDLGARRRSMHGAEIRERRTYGDVDASTGGGLAGEMGQGLHTGVGHGMGNSNTYPEFCDQGIDTKGPFIDRSAFGGLGRPFDPRDGHAGLPDQRGGVVGSMGNGLPNGGYDDGGLDTKGPFLSTRSSPGLSGTFPPENSRPGPSGQRLLDVVTEYQLRKPGGSGIAGRYLWELRES